MLKPGEIIPLKDDDMFTEVFNNKANICVIEEFIATYFNYELQEIRGNITILPRKLSKSKAKEKSKEVDLLLKYKNKSYNIEMTTGWSQAIRDRNVVFLSNIHGSQLNKGDKYYQIDESIQLNLCAFKNSDKTRDIYYIKNQNNEILTNKFRIDIVYMEKLKDMCYTGNKEIDALITWSRIFQCNTQDELKKELKEILSNTSRHQLLTDISRLSGDEDMVKKYEGKSKWEEEKDCIMYELNEEMDNLKHEKNKLEEEKNKLEEEKNKLEEEKNNLEEEKNNLEEEKNKLEEDRKKLIKQLIDLNLSVEEISNKLNVSKEYIQNLKD